MNISLFLLDAAKAALILGATLLAVRLLGRASASLRHFVLAAGLAAVVTLPIARAVAPSWHIDAGIEASTDVAVVTNAPVSESIVAEPGTLPTVAERVAPPAAAPTIPAKAPVSWQQIVATVWALGVLLVLGRIGAGLFRARRLVARSEDLDPGTLTEVKGALGAERLTARIRVSDALATPVVAGVLRPTVVVPREALRWSPERWRVVLLHELAHVRRRDTLTQLVAQIACAMHWFNPLSWIAARQLRKEREHAADDAVLAAGARASSYAEHLLAVAATDDTPPPAWALAMAERSELGDRVRALLDRSRARGALGPVRITVAMVATGALLVGVACATPDGQPTAHVVGHESGAAPSGPIADAVGAFLGTPASRTVLTIDPAVQAVVDEELARLGADKHPEKALAIVLDPRDGAILAVASLPGGEPLAISAAYHPGSTAKLVAMTAALEEGTIKEHQQIFCENGARSYPDGDVLHDNGSNGTLEPGDILAVSSNIGTAKIAETVGGERMVSWFHRFHFGEKPPVQIRGAAPGATASVIDLGTVRGGAIVNGEGFRASALQMAAAYATIANGGLYNAPTLVRKVLGDDGVVTWEHRPTAERVVREETARTMLALLEGVVNHEHSTAKAARIQGTRVAGKTGTATFETREDDKARVANLAKPADEKDERYYASFVGIAPVEKPRFVILVGAVVPATDDASGGTISAPVFARIASRVLAH